MADPFNEFMRMVAIGPAPNHCWLWRGRVDRLGYGKIGAKMAHRVAYEALVGPIPDGLVLDHRVCDTPRCIRPDHLVPCTSWENTQRGRSPHATNWRKTECIHGHPFDDGNTYRHNLRRYCRACNLKAVTKYRARQAGAA